MNITYNNNIYYSAFSFLQNGLLILLTGRVKIAIFHVIHINHLCLSLRVFSVLVRIIYLISTRWAVQGSLDIFSDRRYLDRWYLGGNVNDRVRVWNKSLFR